PAPLAPRLGRDLVPVSEDAIARGRIPLSRRPPHGPRRPAGDRGEGAVAEPGSRRAVERLGIRSRRRPPARPRVAFGRSGADPGGRPSRIPGVRLPPRRERPDPADRLDGAARDSIGPLRRHPGGRDALPGEGSGRRSGRAASMSSAADPAHGTRARLAVLAVFAVNAIYFPELFPPANGPNELSRYEAVVAFVDHGTFAIDSTLKKYGDHEDKSVYGGRTYSNKAPGLIFAAIPVYRLL